MSLRRSAGVLAALLFGLAGCGGETARPARPSAAPDALSGPACRQILAKRGIVAQAWQGGSASCPVDTPVRAAAGPTMRFNPALETSCAMLAAWSGFEAAVDRAARDHLRSRVVAIRHFGSFACRRMTGNAGRRSLHAQARALDIAGFALADGRIVSVQDGWRGPRDQQRFLRAVAASACRYFSVTLTPDSDRFHRDHLHVDIGPWRRCG
jgi:hypothetical protein